MKEDLRHKETTCKKINQFISEFGDFPHSEELTQSIWSLLRLHDLHGSLSDYKMMTRVIKEIRKTLHVFGRHADHRKVCVFGSARTPADHIDYQMAENFSREISKQGFMVITGAGGGIMEAGNKGAGVNMSFGMNIDLPFEQDPNPYIASSSKLVNYHYFFTRKLAFIRESDATVLFPGGFGTHDEGFENLTLTQTGRCAPRPLVMIADKSNSYWQTFAHMVKTEFLDKQLICPDDTYLFKVTNTIEDAIQYVTQFYRVYHSIRYLDHHATMRLNQPISPQLLDEINAEFKGILTEGKFVLGHAEDCADDAHFYPDKPRLIFSFDRRQYGTLHRLILRVNEAR